MGEQAPYATSQDALKVLSAWKSGGVRPGIMIIAPTYGVGEATLIDELADALYQLRGFTDARRRHYISRRLPRALSEAAMARFVDQALDASEISDAFVGVDCIDLSEWLDCQPSPGEASWGRFVSYVRDHGESDFVFLAYGQDPRPAKNLAAGMSMACGRAVVPVELECPSVRSLAEAFVERDPTRFGAHSELVARCLAEARESGFQLNYTFVRACADVASHDMSMGREARVAIGSALDGALMVGAGMRRRFAIGFGGGER